MCYSGFTGSDVRRAVFPLVDDWPLMLGIMAGMDQKDIFLRVRLTRRRLRQWLVRGWLCWFSSLRRVPSCVVRPRCLAPRPVWIRMTSYVV